MDLAIPPRVPRRGGRRGGGGERSLPARSKSDMGGMDRPSIRHTKTGTPMRAKSGDMSKLKRSNTSDGGMRAKPRKKKRGIRVAITVTKREKDDDDDEDEEDATGEDKKDDEETEDLKIYNLQVICGGKYKKKSCWPDIDAMWQNQDDVDKDKMCDLLEKYGYDFYPDRKDEANVKPKRCYIQDCRLRGITFYKDYGWDEVELHLRARAKDPVEILECHTKQIKLEDIPYSGTEDINQILLERGDKTVTSTLTKSILQGHPLALAMMQSETQIVTEFRGLQSVVGVLGNDDDTMLRETNDIGDYTWRDVKTLRALLADKPLPVKEGKGSQRILEVMGLETYLKARVYYKGYFEGDVVSDHGIGLLLGQRWWAHPIKDIMNGFGQDNEALIWEDIELTFFSEINYKMDNEYFDWENHGGKWVKVKKTREPQS